MMKNRMIKNGVTKDEAANNANYGGGCQCVAPTADVTNRYVGDC
jgi:hypothetical protein